ncbi:MAG: M23 family metallopeptidase [Deltaproteobacteria bacterium]|nr:M23 family metallopeptidase [Deltaproteobacteria bacterium]
MNALDPRDPWPVGRPLFIPGRRPDDRRSRVSVGQAPPPRNRLPIRLVWPVPSGRLSSPFGPRAGRPHEGIDIRAPEGSPVVAAAAGTVVYAGSGVRGYGHLVLVRHANGVVTVYAHNRRNLVKEGDAVTQGQPIAEVGRSGRSDGFHLHFEVREGETPRDPLIDLRAPP